MNSADTGAGSLREVIAAVNLDPTYTTLQLGGQGLGPGAGFNPYPLLRPASGTLTIEGGGGTLDGGGINRPFFVYSGAVTIRNLTLANSRAFGGDGHLGGGGGGGFGGAIFVRAGAHVTAENVIFSANSATGGNGGFYQSSWSGAGGGGGMGGHGGGVEEAHFETTKGSGGGGLGGVGGAGSFALNTGGAGGGGIRAGSFTAAGGNPAGSLGFVTVFTGLDGGFIGGANAARGGVHPLAFQATGNRASLEFVGGVNGGGGGAGGAGGTGSAGTVVLGGSAGGGGGLVGGVPHAEALLLSQDLGIGNVVPANAAGFGFGYGQVDTSNGGFGGGGGGASDDGTFDKFYHNLTGGSGGPGGGGGGGGVNTLGKHGPGHGGSGGFGGGGGAANNSGVISARGGVGGFGGGGGGASKPFEGQGVVGSAGGFGAGTGGDSISFGHGGGGGGLGAGGAVYVMTGGSLVLIDPTFSGSAFTVSGGASGGNGSGAGQSIGAGLFLGGNAEIRISSGRTVTLPALNDFIGGGADPEASGSLTKSGPGTLVVSGPNSYVGGTILAGGVLSVSNENQLGAATAPLNVTGGILRVTGTTLSTLGRGMTFVSGGFDVADAALTLTLSQTLAGAGGLSKDGTGNLRLTGTVAYQGATALNAGTLQLDNGLGGSGGTVTVASGATLLAKGRIARPIAGTGTITANAAPLILGDLAQANGFNLSGGPGAGGTLNVGGNQVVLFSASRALLGLQTNLSNGATLATLNGLQLGNATSRDASKILTATGPSILQGAIVNNGTVQGPSAPSEFLVLQNAVSGAGSFTGNVLFNGGYSPGNGPGSVTLENPAFTAVNVLTMELGGVVQGSGYDHLNITGMATWGGTLVVTLINGFTPAAGDSFNLFDGNTTGAFNSQSLPPLAAGLTWETAQFASAGILSVRAFTGLENWRQLHFGSPGNAGSAADSADFDHDGLINLLEYATRTLPTTPNASPLERPSRVLLAGNIPAMRLIFPYLAASTELRYILQRTADLSNPAGWTEVYRNDRSTGVITRSGVSSTENSTSELITIDDPAVGSRYFWRLKIELVP